MSAAAINFVVHLTETTKIIDMKTSRGVKYLSVRFPWKPSSHPKNAYVFISCLEEDNASVF
jgi:hypothetical protein